jgi:hypothetical protein
MLVLGGILALVLVVAGVVVFLSSGDDEVADPTTTSAPASTTTSAPASSTTSAPSSSVAPSAPVDPAAVPAQATGVGTATVQVGRPVTEPYLALITHDGPGAMSFELLDAEGGVVQDLVAGLDSGQYLGVVPVNFGGGEFTAVRFTGEGPWAVTFAVPDSAPDLADAPGSSISKTGDWVVSFAADAATPLTVECSQCTSPIEVRAWSATATATPDPLEVDGGRISVPAGTTYLQVTATGTPGAPAPAWSLVAA